MEKLLDEFEKLDRQANRSNKMILILTIIFTASLIIITLISFKSPEGKQTATVDQQQGINIFLKTTPVSEYTYLGTVKMPGVVWTGKTSEMLRNAVKRAKKQYPTCDGVLIKDYEFETVEAINLK